MQTSTFDALSLWCVDFGIGWYSRCWVKVIALRTQLQWEAVLGEAKVSGQTRA